MNVAASTIGGVYIAWLVAFLVSTAGVTAFGVWATVTAVLAPLSVLDIGLSLVVTRAAAQQKAGGREPAGEAHAATSMYAVVGLLAVAVGSALAFLPETILALGGTSAGEARTVAWVLALDYGVILATAAWGGVLRGQRQYGAVLTSALVQAAVGIAATVVGVALWGLVGAALAQLMAHISGRLVQLVGVRRQAPWYTPVPGIPETVFLRRVVRFSAPLLAISLAGQISFSTDVIVVGALAGATAASWVAVGARLPSLALALVQIGVDVLFPVFVQEASAGAESHTPNVRSGIRVSAFAGAVTFTAMLLARESILAIWIGELDRVALAVFALYCVAWVIHMPAHLIGLLMIARGRHATLAVLVVAEAVVNIALSVYLVATIGPVGAAVASLVAVGLSNLVLVPFLAWRSVGLRLPDSLVDGTLGAGAGVGVAATAYAFVVNLPMPALPSVFIQIVVTALAAVGAAWLLWRVGTPNGRTAP